MFNDRTAMCHRGSLFTIYQYVIESIVSLATPLIDSELKLSVYGSASCCMEYVLLSYIRQCLVYVTSTVVINVQSVSMLSSRMYRYLPVKVLSCLYLCILSCDWMKVPYSIIRIWESRWTSMWAKNIPPCPSLFILHSVSRPKTLYISSYQIKLLLTFGCVLSGKFILFKLTSRYLKYSY